MGDKVASNKINTEVSKCNLITKEFEYYTAAADYMLRIKGNNNPNQIQLLEAKKYLSNAYLGFSIILAAQTLTDKDLLTIYEAACGESINGTAEVLKNTPNVIKKKLSFVLEKLQCWNVKQVAYRLTHMGYFPIPFEKIWEIKEKIKKETEDTAA